MSWLWFTCFVLCLGGWCYHSARYERKVDDIRHVLHCALEVKSELEKEVREHRNGLPYRACKMAFESLWKKCEGDLETRPGHAPLGIAVSDYMKNDWVGAWERPFVNDYHYEQLNIMTLCSWIDDLADLPGCEYGYKLSYGGKAWGYAMRDGGLQELACGSVDLLEERIRDLIPIHLAQQVAKEAREEMTGE